MINLTALAARTNTSNYWTEKAHGHNSVLLKFWGFTGLASLLASVQFTSGDKVGFVHPQISEARCVSGHQATI
jgi:hypothetical protein